MAVRMISLSGKSWLNLAEVVHIELDHASGVVTLRNGQQLALVGDEITALATVLERDTASARELRQLARQAEAERLVAVRLADVLRRKVQRLLADNARLTRQLAQAQTAAPAGEQQGGE